MQYSFIRRLRHASLSLTLGLPSLALASLLGANPGLAAVQSSSPTIENNSETVVIGFIDILLDVADDIINGNIDDAGDIIDVVGDVQKRFDQRAAEQRAEEERQLRELERIRLQEEREAAARAAAEQRRQYFESLTPEQQQAYVQEQQRLQQQQLDFISGIFIEALFSTSTQPDQGDYRNGMSENEYYCYINPSCGR
ncbi:hypothetical protein IQ273_14035 [Nodosilinea sp. LEGE 07298]|uniref:hypothetical protein n=1 Tax=Nodosilinea sp. LEGE 07298 TaxID=2777970 RepID=UPI00187E6DF2|nr:hypothetical protein [Nodosilinea sp. LEGE 07298]MBE9110536.1 hypothetical protein [Nodosilinea sp. LEGE 07298]